MWYVMLRWSRVISASLLATTSQAAELPVLPQEYVDTAYAPVSGATLVVNAGGDLQAALDKARPGDSILLEAGATFDGPLILPNKMGKGWIHVRSSALGSLPRAGKRVTPANAGNMPKITVRAGRGAAIRADRAAHHFRFVGIEIKPAIGQFVYNLVEIGRGEAAIGDLPHDIIFDRCYIHGDPVVGGRRGVAMNGVRLAVIDSHLSDFKERGADTQALWTYNTPGPLKIANNYLEAAGENFMSGGSDSKNAEMVPSDIEVRGNHFFKPLAWIGEPWSVKNLFELKSARRVLVEGNFFENNWPAAQNGFAVLFTPRNQDGKAPWSAVQDVTFRLNKLINLGQGFNIAGRDGPLRSEVTRRVLIEHNLVLVSRLHDANGRIFQIVGGPADVTIRHNTGLITAKGGTATFSENEPRAYRVDFRDNLLSSGDYGFIGTGTGPGAPTLERHFLDTDLVGNVLIGGSGNYPRGNHFPSKVAAVGFLDFEGGNFRLGIRSPFRNAATDGKDIGADIDALEKAVAGAALGRMPKP